jgi:hypothetical protein
MQGKHEHLRHALGAAFLITVALWAPLMRGKDKPKTAPAATSAPATPSLAQSLTGQAKNDYEAARILYGDGDFAGALVKFTAAYEQSHDARLLWNMGACEKNLRHYAKVLSLIRRYVSEGGGLITDQDRTEARDLISTVEAFTAALTVTVNEQGAAVFIDDEPVGTTPLPAPVIVDLGTRKLRVEKAGFVTYQASLGVGGSRELSQDVRLAKEVHEGKLTVRANAGARIVIDGNEVGKGMWTGTLPSRGHTLRVEQDGMIPHQSEVAIQDGENRVVEVPLAMLPTPQIQVVPPQAEKPNPPRFELGVRGGYGIVYPRGSADGAKNVGFAPFWLDVASRRRVASLGVFFQYAGYDHGGTCGVNRHGYEPESASDLRVRYAYTSCQHYAAGFQVLFHMLPSLKVDPWMGFDIGGQYSVRKFKSFDPLTGQYGEGTDGGPSAGLGAQFGIDFKLVGGLAFGPFIRAAGLFGEDLKIKNSQEGALWTSSSSQCPAGAQCQSNDDEGLTVSLQMIFGVRVGYTF